MIVNISDISPDMIKHKPNDHGEMDSSDELSVQKLSPMGEGRLGT